MENKNKLLLPKPHISWSQLTCWLTNKERYRREYFENGTKLDSKFLRFGKGIADLIENGKHKELIPDLIVYDTPEFEIKTEVLGVPILSYLDSYDSKENVFREYKTGKVPWTQAKVIKHGQLVFYATALKWSKGVMPDYCDLDWVQTKEGGVEVDDFWRTNEGQINVTGHIQSFHRPFREVEVERMEQQILKVATEISEAYKEFIKEI